MRAASAPDGASALRAVREANLAGQPFDLAILDMQMPGMDGLALARALRRLSSVVQVVQITADEAPWSEHATKVIPV